MGVEGVCKLAEMLGSAIEGEGKRKGCRVPRYADGYMYGRGG